MKTIQGYVEPVTGAGKGTPQVAVVDGTIEYHVVPKGAGVDLAEHLSRQVEVFGTVAEQPEGPALIHVRSYTLLDPLDDDAWYEDDED